MNIYAVSLLSASTPSPCPPVRCQQNARPDLMCALSRVEENFALAIIPTTNWRWRQGHCSSNTNDMQPLCVCFNGPCKLDIACTASVVSTPWRSAADAGHNMPRAYNCTRCNTKGTSLCRTIPGELAHWIPQAAPRVGPPWLHRVTVILVSVRRDNLTAPLIASGVVPANGRLKKRVIRPGNRPIAPQPAVSWCCLITLSSPFFLSCISTPPHRFSTVFSCKRRSGTPLFLRTNLRFRFPITAEKGHFGGLPSPFPQAGSYICWRASGSLLCAGSTELSSNFHPCVCLYLRCRCSCTLIVSNLVPP